MKVQSVCDAVFDCNIFLQAAARPASPAGECLSLAEKGFVRLFVSKDVLTEISGVLRRPIIQNRFSALTDENIDLFLERARGFSHFVKNVPVKFNLSRDVDDEIYINLAVVAKADFLVSRDNDLLDLMNGYSTEAKEFRQRFRFLRVVEPLEFLKIVREKLILE